MLPKIKATVLIDNKGQGSLSGEWGLCVYIQYGEKTILLDAGGSDLFENNARALGLSIADVDLAVLSHAHYDHSLGMRKFFSINPRAPFYLQKEAEENCYHRKTYLKLFHHRKYIGLPRGITKEFSDRIIRTDADYSPAHGIWIIPHHTPELDTIGKRESMLLKTGSGWKYDDFSHEQSLVFETEKGLVIFNSCSHGGAANIIREVSKVFPRRKVYAMIGGFHLFNKTDEEVRAFAADVRGTGIQYVCTGHCTGDRAFGILRDELGDILHPLHVGLVMEF